MGYKASQRVKQSTLDRHNLSEAEIYRMAMMDVIKSAPMDELKRHFACSKIEVFEKEYEFLTELK